MDALRQVERSKQQAVGVDNPPKSSVGERYSGEHPSRKTLPPIMMAGTTGIDSQPSGYEILHIESGNEDGKTEPISKNAEDTLEVREVEEVITESGLPEVFAAVDPPAEENIDVEAAAGPVIEVADGEAEQASPEYVQQMVNPSDTPVVPIMAITGAPVETSKQAARAVFAAQSKQRRVVRRRRLLLMGLAGFAMLGATGFLLYPYQSMVNFASPMVIGRMAAPPAEPVNVPKEATVAEAATLSVTPPADMEESSAGNDGAGLSGRETVADRRASPGRTGTSPAQTASDSSQALEPVVQPKIVPGSSSFMPAARPESPSGHMPAVAQTDPGPEPFPLPEPQPLSRPAAITITRSRQAPSQSDPLSAAAYAAYHSGSFDQARRNFQLILQADPDHRGAMLGLAALALRRNEADLARDLYLRLLEQDPSDPLARAGLMAIMPTGDTAGMESELKLLIEVHPNVAPLSFALGNLYAGGRRWNEARQAYFNALQVAGKAASGPVSPDYSFNLAVSLEHLNQSDLAGKYYREALALAADHPAGFDREALRGRLDNFNRTRRNDP